jgi:catalase
MKSKKERVGEENYFRIPVSQFIAPPKTPTTSKLRKDAQDKEKAASSETEALEEEHGAEEEERKIKKKKKSEEEEEDDRAEAKAEVRALLKERDRLDYEDAMLDVGESESENESMSREFLGDQRKAKDRWLKAWIPTRYRWRAYRYLQCLY